MKLFALGLTVTCVLGAYLMPQIAAGCLLIGLVLVAALASPNQETGEG